MLWIYPDVPILCRKRIRRNIRDGYWPRTLSSRMQVCACSCTWDGAGVCMANRMMHQVRQLSWAGRGDWLLHNVRRLPESACRHAFCSTLPLYVWSCQPVLFCRSGMSHDCAVQCHRYRFLPARLPCHVLCIPFAECLWQCQSVSLRPDGCIFPLQTFHPYRILSCLHRCRIVYICAANPANNHNGWGVSSMLRCPLGLSGHRETAGGVSVNILLWGIRDACRAGRRGCRHPQNVGDGWRYTYWPWSPYIQVQCRRTGEGGRVSWNPGSHRASLVVAL